MRAAFVSRDRGGVDNRVSFLQVFHGSLGHEEKRENIRPKRLLELARSNFLNRILQMLLRCIVDQDVDPAEPLLSLCDDLLTKFLIADIAINEQAFASLLFYEPP